MATTFTSNLKLRIDSNLTSDSKFNLRRIDDLGSIYQINTNDVAKVRSKTNILIQPQDPDIGGAGSGGTVSIGTADQPAAAVSIFADAINLGGGLSFADTAAGGTKNLNLAYKSDVSGSVDTAEDRTLEIDVDAADRQLVLGGNLELLNASLTLNLLANTSWTLPVNNGTAGQVLTTDGAGVLTWTSAVATSLNNLLDVNAPAPSDGQVLSYNSGSGFWEASSTVTAVGAETAFTWEPADGSTKTIVHNLGSQQVLATVIDTTDNYKTVEVPDTTRPDGSTIILNATSAPSGGNWLVLLKQILT